MGVGVDAGVEVGVGVRVGADLGELAASSPATNWLALGVPRPVTRS